MTRLLPNEGTWIAYATWSQAKRLALIMAAWRLAIICFTPLEVSGDEAHYWEWSRHLELSYYTKGPGIAYLIAAGTSLLGDNAIGIRFFSVLLGLLTAWCLGRVAMQAWQSERAGFCAVLCHSCLPLLQGMGIIMTIDGPLLACTALALWIAWHWARRPQSLKLSISLGLVIGIGFLFKYTAAVLLISLPLAARGCGRLGPASWRGLVVVCGAFLTASLPVILWNHQEGWPALQHLMGHLGVEGGDRQAKPWRPHVTFPNYVLQQALLYGPFALLGLRIVVGPGIGVRNRLRDNLRHLPTRIRHAPVGWKFCMAFALPSIALYTLVAFKAKVQANWPLMGWLALVPLAGGVLAHEAEARAADAGASPPPLRAAWHLNALAIFGVLFVALVTLLPLGLLAPELRTKNPWRRLHGAEAEAQTVHEAAQALENQLGQRVLIIGNRYDTTSHLAFYLQPRRQIFSAASALGDRRSAYDWFEDTDLDHALQTPQPAILVQGDLETWTAAFELTGLTVLDAEAELYSVEGIQPLPSPPKARR